MVKPGDVLTWIENDGFLDGRAEARTPVFRLNILGDDIQKYRRDPMGICRGEPVDVSRVPSSRHKAFSTTRSIWVMLYLASPSMDAH